jgi:2,3-bisphosphoglycerate-independent phosphoglycerate mutase
VPIIIVDKDIQKINNGILGDLAPTILKLMGIPQPEEMPRHSLI